MYRSLFAGQLVTKNKSFVTPNSGRNVFKIPNGKMKYARVLEHDNSDKSHICNSFLEAEAGFSDISQTKCDQIHNCE